MWRMREGILLNMARMASLCDTLFVDDDRTYLYNNILYACACVGLSSHRL